MGKKIEKLSDVADVDIAEAGCFKYILIEVRERGTGTTSQSKMIVRGNASCAYHGRTMTNISDDDDDDDHDRCV